MATIIINGREYPLPEGEKLNAIQMAMRVGIEIPYYCWHPALSVVANCRMCEIEVGSKDAKTGEIKMLPKLVPGCQTPAKDLTVLVTDSPKVQEHQRILPLGRLDRGFHRALDGAGRGHRPHGGDVLAELQANARQHRLARDGAGARELVIEGKQGQEPTASRLRREQACEEAIAVRRPYQSEHIVVRGGWRGVRVGHGERFRATVERMGSKDYNRLMGFLVPSTR